MSVKQLRYLHMDQLVKTADVVKVNNLKMNTCHHPHSGTRTHATCSKRNVLLFNPNKKQCFGEQNGSTIWELLGASR